MIEFKRRFYFFNGHKTDGKMFILIVLTALSIGTLYRGQGMAKDPADPISTQVKRGEYLVNTSGCHNCHTPWIKKADGPGPDMSRALSGHPEELVMPPLPSWKVLGAGSPPVPIPPSPDLGELATPRT